MYSPVLACYLGAYFNMKVFYGVNVLSQQEISSLSFYILHCRVQFIEANMKPHIDTNVKITNLLQTHTLRIADKPAYLSSLLYSPALVTISDCVCAKTWRRQAMMDIHNSERDGHSQLYCTLCSSFFTVSHT